MPHILNRDQLNCDLDSIDLFLFLRCETVPSDKDMDICVFIYVFFEQSESHLYYHHQLSCIDIVGVFSSHMLSSGDIHAWRIYSSTWPLMARSICVYYEVLYSILLAGVIVVIAFDCHQGGLIYGSICSKPGYIYSGQRSTRFSRFDRQGGPTRLTALYPCMIYCCYCYLCDYLQDFVSKTPFLERVDQSHIPLL